MTSIAEAIESALASPVAGPPFDEHLRRLKPSSVTITRYGYGAMTQVRILPNGGSWISGTGYGWLRSSRTSVESIDSRPGQNSLWPSQLNTRSTWKVGLMPTL